MSSKSSSSAATSTTTNDNDVAADGKAIVGQSDGGNVTINSTPDGAFDFGVEFAELVADMGESTVGVGERLSLEALETGKAALIEAFSQSQQLSTQSAAQASTALSTVNKVLDATLLEGRDDSTEISQQLLRMGIPAAIIIFALTRLT